MLNEGARKSKSKLLLLLLIVFLKEWNLYEGGWNQVNGPVQQKRTSRRAYSFHNWVIF